MIEVIVMLNGKQELARMTIENMTEGDTDFADYSVRFGVDQNGNSAIRQRAIYHFPRKRFHVLALVRQALATLESADLELHETLTKNEKQTRLGWRVFFS